MSTQVGVREVDEALAVAGELDFHGFWRLVSRAIARGEHEGFVASPPATPTDATQEAAIADSVTRAIERGRRKAGIT